MADRRPDVMKSLADARPPELDPEHLAGSVRARDDLVSLLADAPEGPVPSGAGPVRRLMWRWALPVAATAVTAGVLVGVLSQGTSVPEAAPATAGPGPDSPRHTPENGRLALLNVAARLDSAAGAGTYWQVTTRSAWIGMAAVSGPGFAVVSSSTQRQSIGVRPGTQSLVITGLDATTAPRTRRDTARWKAAGSPKELTLADSGAGGTLGLRMETASERRPTVDRTDLGDRIAAIGARNVTYADLRKLPGDTAKLREVLARLYEEDKGSEISGRTEWMWRQASNLINLPVAADVRAAAYRVIAGLPGIRSLGEVTDPLGRKGAGFALPPTVRPGYGAVRPELIVDAATGALLADQEVLTRPSAKAAEAGLTAGTPVHYTATVRSRWTDRQLKTPR
ncbi:hypothetical protein A6A06_16035 [Streptomyces sp. CB02923]|uniref:CU044_5270 family protein n=1 Tax=Streptomyces sp. CB02923 TaxID=1718985 RepID=UPI00093E2AA2|nr:CU044_5270 family protein [Streptomyces sp. CB02923]OKI02529.1 hypothetical protein A6A06_16035 [Streptomyces sp. CB02923]